MIKLSKEVSDDEVNEDLAAGLEVELPDLSADETEEETSSGLNSMGLSLVPHEEDEDDEDEEPSNQ